MARGTSYGEMLREARLRRGMDLPSVARRLRVRADILAAIEDADFAALPPSGYTRNMINAYARLVGEDPRELSSRYLDELHLFETGRMRTSRDREPTGGPSGARSGDRLSRTVRSRAAAPQRRPVSTMRRPSDDAPQRRAPLPSRPSGASASRGYTQPSSRYRERYGDERLGSYPVERDDALAGRGYHSQGAYRRDDRGAMRAGGPYASPAPSRGYGDPSRSYGRETLRAYDSYASQPSEPRPTRTGRRDRGLPAKEYATSPYAGLYSRRNHDQRATFGDVLSTGAGAIAQRLPLVIGIIVVIVLLIVIVSFIGRGGEPAPDETPTMPISGLTDTSTQNADAYNVSATETAPTSAKFSYEVEAGGRSWIELSVDGSSEPEVSEVVQGPQSKEVEFTESISFSCGNPTPVTIKVDGKEVEPTYSSADEEYVYTVTFSSILSEWQRAHPTAPGANTGSPSSSSSSSSGSSGR